MAIIGLIVAGTLVTALVSVTVRDHREGRNTRTMGQAFAAAETGLSETVGNWTGGTYNGLVVDDSVTVTGSTASGIGAYSATVKRLNNELFIVDVLGHDANSGARQRVGAFVKLRLLEIDIQAALTTQGAVKIGGTANISGYDEDPYGWAACPADSDLAGIRLPDSTQVNGIGGCNNLECIGGVPDVQGDPTINDSTFFDYGDTDWNGLVAMANKLVTLENPLPSAPAFTASGACDLSVATNWGDPWTPTSACGSYFPILYRNGSLKLQGGQGQGILLVDGNLTVTGGFEFFGIVIVRGVLATAGTGGHFNGAVMAANVDLNEISVLGDALIQYSQCAKMKALSAAGTGAMLRSRGWLYSY